MTESSSRMSVAIGVAAAAIVGIGSIALFQQFSNKKKENKQVKESVKKSRASMPAKLPSEGKKEGKVVEKSNLSPSDKAREEGNNAFKEKNYDAALKFYSEAIDLDSKNYQAYCNRGMTYKALGMIIFASSVLVFRKLRNGS